MFDKSKSRYLKQRMDINMKLSMIAYLFTALFGAGFVFFRLNCHFAGRRFVLSLKSAAACVWASVFLMGIAGMLHHGVMLLGEHLIFDAIGSGILAVLMSCAVALVRETCFARRRKAPAQNVVRHRHSNVIDIPQKSRRTSSTRKNISRIAA